MSSDARPTGIATSLADAARQERRLLDSLGECDRSVPCGAWFWPLPSLGPCRPAISEGASSQRLRADIIYEGGPHELAVSVPEDVPVLAASDGIVSLTKWSARGFSIVIRHANGWATYYAHLARPAVSPDQIVGAGEPIALVGHAPGDTRHPRHIHFELWRRGRRSCAVDPRPYLATWRCLPLIDWSRDTSVQLEEDNIPCRS